MSRIVWPIGPIFHGFGVRDPYYSWLHGLRCRVFGHKWRRYSSASAAVVCARGCRGVAPKMLAP